jgi:glycosyltransferase involved in cell wall biosynthesis
MSDFHPLVSIIIPVYNGANYMREAIDSALAQSYDNCEVIVVNDGSTDDGETDRIARSYEDKIRYFAKENGGVATALNLGIREMRGEYFSWLSHDDVYLPYKIERQVAFMERLELQDAVLYSDYAVIDSKGRHISNKHLSGAPPDAAFHYLYLMNEIHGCTLFIPRQAFNSVGMFPEELETTQDYDLWMRMCLAYPFVYQAEILIQVRRHAAQGSKTIKNHKEGVASFYQRYLPDVVEILIKTKTKAEAARQRLWLIEQLYRQGLNKQAESVAGLAESDEEREAVNTIRQKRIKIIAKNLSKRGFRAFWRILPKYTKRMAKYFFRNPQLKKTFVQRLDFKKYYVENKFGAVESFSGAGSSLFQTRIVRRELPNILNKLQINSVLDIPCGDFNWMQHIDLGTIHYTGGDIVAELAERNRLLHGSEQRSFERLDAINGPLPKADLIFCRDCFVHLPFIDCLKALRTFKASQAMWLLTTTFSERTENIDLIADAWRPLNLCLSPFNLPEPALLINEKCTEGGGMFADKALGLWDLRSLTL